MENQRRGEFCNSKTLTSSCTIIGTVIAPASVIVPSGKALTVNAESTFLIDFKHEKLLVQKGGGVLIKKTGTVRQLKAFDTAPVLYYHHTDHLGSIAVSTDINGVVTELSDYYPYGGVRMDEKSGLTEQRKYIGQEFDAATNLSYLNARYYDGSRGQFLSQDPVFWGRQNLADPQSLNSYSYARNNPLRFLDPNGTNILNFVPGSSSNQGSYNGINIYSNGGDSNSYYQCTEFADRFMESNWGVSSTAINGMTGANGKDYTASTFNNSLGSSEQTFVTSYNGQADNTLPLENSIISFGPSADNEYGHVGVIGSVYFDEKTNKGNVVIAQQNTKQFQNTLGLSRNKDGAYQIQNFSGMPVVGWTSPVRINSTPSGSSNNASGSSHSIISGLLNTISGLLSVIASLVK